MAIGTIFIVSFITALSGALMPGPLLTVTIAQTAKRGFIASAFLVIGHSVLELIVVIGLWFGLGSILQIKPVIGTITVLGGAVLLWMGMSMIRDARRGVLDVQAAMDGKAVSQNVFMRNPVFAGIAVSLSNPYWTIWWATIGITLFAALSQNGLFAIGAFYFGHIMGDIVWYLAIGVAVSTGRRLINPNVYNIIVQICGILLLLLGLSFLYLIISGNLWHIRMDLSALQDKLRGH